VRGAGRPTRHLHPLVLTGLPPTATGLGEHPASAVEGCNDFGEEGYGGPLPPVGDEPTDTSSVFATSAPLELTAGASAEDLRRALERKQLAGATLVGTYQRQPRRRRIQRFAQG